MRDQDELGVRPHARRRNQGEQYSELRLAQQVSLKRYHGAYLHALRATPLAAENAEIRQSAMSAPLQRRGNGEGRPQLSGKRYYVR